MIKSGSIRKVRERHGLEMDEKYVRTKSDPPLTEGPLIVSLPRHF
jgi:hypothetical protein